MMCQCYHKERKKIERMKRDRKKGTLGNKKQTKDYTCYFNPEGHKKGLGTR
jgi:hypothetical protein